MGSIRLPVFGQATAKEENGYCNSGKFCRSQLRGTLRVPSDGCKGTIQRIEKNEQYQFTAERRFASYK